MADKAEVTEYKGYNLGNDGTFSMLHIKAKGQGMVPKPLQGMYTSHNAARQAIDAYLNSLMKGRKNGKTKDTASG